ncbi:MAG TPA: hydroxymethylbilane synthase [Dehalococcoidia bacterium]|nr:hydroxymethylbilane synthase [Dehalococcoidia bacterium]
MRPIRLGTRGSELARFQANETAEALRAQGFEAELVIITTTGDRDRVSSLLAIGGQGVFVRELEKALIEDRIDIAVHSAKDAPTDLAADTTLCAFLPRADVRDALISRNGEPLAELAEGATVGSSSRRRIAQLKALRPDLRIAELRGNVDTRLGKLRDGGYDAIVLAAAGLTRLGRADEISEFLTIERMLPAPGQGAVALQTRVGDSATEAAAAINHESTETAVRAERAVLEALGAGCTLPVAALAHRSADALTLLARVLDGTGERSLTRQRRGEATDPEGLGHALGEELMTQGAAELLQEVLA